MISAIEDDRRIAYDVHHGVYCSRCHRKFRGDECDCLTRGLPAKQQAKPVEAGVECARCHRPFAAPGEQVCDICQQAQQRQELEHYA